MASSGAIGTHGPKTASRGVPKGTSADPNRPGSCGTSSAAQSRCPAPRPPTLAHLQVLLASVSAGLGGREDTRPAPLPQNGGRLFSAMVQVLGRELFVEGRTVFVWSGSRAYSGFWRNIWLVDCARRLVGAEDAGFGACGPIANRTAARVVVGIDVWWHMV